MSHRWWKVIWTAGALLYAVVPALGQTQSAYRISTVAGTGFVGDGGAATAATLSAVEGMAVDVAGNLYIADNAGHRIRRVEAGSGKISTVAGNGTPGLRGDGGPAAASVLNSPYGMTIDAGGNLYFADFGNRRIRRIAAADGTISTVAGGGGGSGSATDALSASFLGPRNVAVDRAGNLFVSDYADHRIYRVTPDGRISVAAGTGSAGYNGDGAALTTQLRFPAGLAADRDGAVWVADSGNKMIRRLAGGQIATVISSLSTPLGLALDAAGALLVADGGANVVVRRSADGTVSTIAGLSPKLAGPVRDVAAGAAAGGVWFSHGRQAMRLVPGAAAPLVVAGDGAAAVKVVENSDARMSVLQSPMGVAVDSAGQIYIAEEALKRVRGVSSGGLIRTVAGGALPTGLSVGDGGAATAARLFAPAAVAWDAVAGLRIADAAGHRIRGVLTSGTIFTVAGDGEPGYGGDASPAAQARLNRPRGVAFDRAGNLYIADSGNHRIRRIGANGFITTVAGSGVRGYFGDGGAAVQCQLNAPQGVAADTEGNLYIADTGNNVIRRVSAAGVVSTLAGTGARGFAGDGGSAALAAFNAPAAVAVDAQGLVLIADTFNNRIRRIGGDGRIHTIAGDGGAGFWGDDGAAVAAQLNAPTGLAVDTRTGAIFVADFDNQRVRMLTPDASLTPVETPSKGEANEAPPPAAEVIVMNAASLRSGPIAPGMIASLFGAAIGPERAAASELTAQGRLPLAVSGVEVRFDDLPAPIFYAGPQQLNVEVPRLAAPKESVRVEVRRDGKVIAAANVRALAAQPAFFTMQQGVGQAIAINEDGTLNSESNPAARGSIVTLFATGDGATDPAGTDGLPASAASPPRPAQPVSVRVGSADAEVLFAGRAPGLVGLMQLNVRLPGFFTPPGTRALSLTVGAAISQPGVTIVVR